MEKAALDSIPQDSKEEDAPTDLDVEIIVYTSSHNQFAIKIGLVKREQLEGLHQTIRATFETLAPTRGLTFVDQLAVTRHFNTAHITCIEVNIR